MNKSKVIIVDYNNAFFTFSLILLNDIYKTSGIYNVYQDLTLISVFSTKPDKYLRFSFLLYKGTGRVNTRTKESTA